MNRPGARIEIDSIMEFYRRWPGLRKHPEALLACAHLSAEQREVLDWMIRVVDRVGPADLREDDRN